MLKIKKDLNPKIISLVIAVLFFLNSAVYGIDTSTKSHLRVPLQTSDHDGQRRFEGGLAETATTQQITIQDLPGPFRQSVYRAMFFLESVISAVAIKLGGPNKLSINIKECPESTFGIKYVSEQQHMLTIERPLLEHMPDDIVERLIYELNGRDHDSNTAAVTAYLALCKAVEDGAEVKGIYDGSSIKLTTSGVQPDFVAILQQRFTAMLQLTNNMPPNFTIRFTRDPLKTNNDIFFINPMDDIVYMQPTFFNFHEVRQLIMLYRAIIKSPQNMDNSDMIHFAFGLQRYMAPFWDQTWSKAPLNKGPKDFAVELVRKGKIRAGHKVLCLGEGFGFDAMFFALQQCHVTATDFSSVAIEHINKLAKEKHIKSSLHGEVLDMRQLFSYADASFDIVCAFQSLMYFDDNAFRQIIKEIYRVLKPGGRVFISVRSKDDYKYKDNPLRIGNISLDRQGRVRRFYDREELISFFNKEGFKNIEAYEKPLEGYKNEPVSSTIRLSAEKTSDDPLGKKIIKPILLGTAI